MTRSNNAGSNGHVPCAWFDEHGLQRLEEDGVSDPAIAQHIETCAACAQALRAHLRLRERLAAMKPDLTGDADWQARVWAQLDRQQPHSGARPRRTRHRRWVKVAVPMAALAAAAAVIFLIRAVTVTPTGDAELQAKLEVHWELRTPDSATTMRTEQAKPGDIVWLTASIGDATSASIWVYDDEGQLTGRCSELASCQRTDDTIQLRLPLDTRGRHRIVALSSRGPLPAPQGRFQSDLIAARRADAKAEVIEVDVH